MYKKFVFAVVIFTTLVLVSCKNENPLDTEENQSSIMNIENLDSRLDRNLEMVDLETPFGIDHKNGKIEKMKDNHQKRAEKMKKIMKEKLGLSDQQIEQMKTAKDEMKDCTESAKTGIKSIIDAEFEIANAKRDVIITSMKNKEITKDEAKELIKTLKSEVKESINSNTEIIAFKEELKVCHTEMKTKMESILTAEQLEKMKEIKNKHEKGHHKRKK